jgi:hypothetical protein
MESQPQKSVTLRSQPGGETTKSIRDMWWHWYKKNFWHDNTSSASYVNIKLNPETSGRGSTAQTVPTIKQTCNTHFLNKRTVRFPAAVKVLWLRHTSLFTRQERDFLTYNCCLKRVKNRCKTSHYYIKSITPDKVSHERARFAVLLAMMTNIQVLGCYALSNGKQKFRRSVQLPFVGSKPKILVTGFE